MEKKILVLLVFSTLLFPACLGGEDNRPAVLNAPSTTSLPPTTPTTLQVQERIEGGLSVGTFFPPRILDAGGKMAYYFFDGERIQVLFEDKKEFGAGYGITAPVNVVSDKLAALAYKEETPYVIYGSQTIPFYGSYIPEDADILFTEDEGKLAYLTYNESFGEETGEEIKPYIVSGKSWLAMPDNSYITLLPSVAGRLTYSVYDITSGKSYIVSGGQEYGREYDNAYIDVSSTADVGGEIAYTAVKNNRSFIAYDKKEYGKEYFDVFSPFSVDGKLGYVAAEENMSLPLGIKKFIVYDGKELGKEYDTVDPYSEDGVAAIDGKIAFLAVKGDRNVVLFNGKEYGLEYDNVYRVASVGNTLSFVGSIGYEYHLVYGDEEIIVPAYESGYEEGIGESVV